MKSSPEMPSIEPGPCASV